MHLKITGMNLHIFMNSTKKFRLANFTPLFFYEGSKLDRSWSSTFMNVLFSAFFSDVFERGNKKLASPSHLYIRNLFYLNNIIINSHRTGGAPTVRRMGELTRLPHCFNTDYLGAFGTNSYAPK